MNEAETRAEHIDPALTAAGWSVVDGSRVLREYRITLGRIEGPGRRGKPHQADYVLIINAERSDLFDVLAHVAYALPPVTRAERAARARLDINATFNRKQQLFLDFVLSHYVSVGVEELDQDKLTPLLRLRYHNSIADAVEDLGRPDDIGRVFAGFQKFLYQPQDAISPVAGLHP